MLKLYTCVDHKGVEPTGVASIVLAENELEARRLLHNKLKLAGLGGADFTLREIPMTNAVAYILCDGDY